MLDDRTLEDVLSLAGWMWKVMIISGIIDMVFSVVTLLGLEVLSQDPLHSWVG